MPVDSENRCAKCQKANPEGQRFCGFCGAPLAAAYLTPEPETLNAASAESPPVSVSETVAHLLKEAESQPAPSLTVPPEPAVPVSAPEVPPPASRPKPDIAIPDNPIAREVERDKLMTLAGVQRARGQVTDARETLEKALLMAQGGGPREIATIQEEIGDLLMIEEELEEASAIYQEALKTDPSRVSAEKKYARAQMAISDREAEKRLGQKALQGDSMAEIITSGGLAGRAGRRNAGLAMILSLVPGFGQFYNGQFVKGAILLATFSLAMGILTFTPDGKDLVQSFAATMALKPGKAASVSPMTLGVGIIAVAAWLYSIVDAPFFASKTSDSGELLTAAPRDSIDIPNDLFKEQTGKEV